MRWGILERKNWARVVSVVLVCLGTLPLISGLVLGPAGVVTVSWALSWLAGLTAVILLFQRPSNTFFALPDW
jgi:hypothetical protein